MRVQQKCGITCRFSGRYPQQWSCPVIGGRFAHDGRLRTLRFAGRRPSPCRCSVCTANTAMRWRHRVERLRRVGAGVEVSAGLFDDADPHSGSDVEGAHMSWFGDTISPCQRIEPFMAPNSGCRGASVIGTSLATGRPCLVTMISVPASATSSISDRQVALNSVAATVRWSDAGGRCAAVRAIITS